MPHERSGHGPGSFAGRDYEQRLLGKSVESAAADGRVNEPARIRSLDSRRKDAA